MHIYADTQLHSYGIIFKPYNFFQFSTEQSITTQHADYIDNERPPSFFPLVFRDFLPLLLTVWLIVAPAATAYI